MRIVPPPKPFFRKPLSHVTHFDGRFGATYFITICCRKRHANSLCNELAAKTIFETAALYDRQQKWFLLLMLLMPDHLHALVAVGVDVPLGQIIGNFKRATSRFGNVVWQRNFFDH